MESEGQGKRAPSPLRVAITSGQVAMCVEFARECEQVRGYARSGGWRGGLLTARTLFGGHRVESHECSTVIGKIGEVAMCILAGEKVDTAIRRSGDGGKDLRLPCGSVQVKTSSSNSTEKLVKDPPEMCDWFVFVRWDGVCPVVFVDGYISRSFLFNREPQKSRRGSWMNRVVMCSELRPIRSLLAIRPISEVI